MTPKQISYENQAKTIIGNLKKRRMEGFYFPDKESAARFIEELVPEGSSVAWGGSMTLNETKVMDILKGGKYEVIDRDTAVNDEKRKEVYGKIVSCDYFFMSTNAITLDGELVNTDGRGNRVAFLCFGPDNVIVVAGMNKVVSDTDAAIKRIHDVATPANTVRLNKKTPCSVTGRCADCLSDDCICASTVITRFSMIPGRIKVILVGEELGY